MTEIRGAKRRTSRDRTTSGRVLALANAHSNTGPGQAGTYKHCKLMALIRSLSAKRIWKYSSLPPKRCCPRVFLRSRYSMPPEKRVQPTVVFRQSPQPDEDGMSCKISQTINILIKSILIFSLMTLREIRWKPPFLWRCAMPLRSTYNPDNDNTLSNLALSAFLRTERIHRDPGYYFEKDDPARRSALDLWLTPTQKVGAASCGKRWSGVTLYTVKHPVSKTLVIED